MRQYWSKASWKLVSKSGFYESNLLKLNISKAKSKLKWQSILTFKETVKMVTDWYKNYYTNSKRISEASYNQIKKYEKLLNKRSIK